MQLRAKECRMKKNSTPCSQCYGNSVYQSNTSKCSSCGESQLLIICLDCDFKKRVCRCSENIRHSTERKSRVKDLSSDYDKKFLCGCSIIVVVFVAVLGSAIYSYWLSAPPSPRETLNLFKELKKKYPSQKNETWFHILSVLEEEKPTVKSLILLHGEDKRTSKCLTRTLVSKYRPDKVSEKDGIVFSSVIWNEKRDYGEVLEHYRPVVRKHRVLVTDLNEVPPSTARIFHSLCDEESSDIKPSLFIFTLQYDEKTEKLKPLERATTVLKEIWRELPDSDIFPLLSRVVKNVVDLVPEKVLSC